MNKFLEIYSLPRLNQGENLNWPTTGNEDEIEIKKKKKKIPRNKSPGPKSFKGEFYPTFKEELISMLLKIFL